MNISLKNKEFWEDFVELYKSYPCLWDVRQKEYSNKTVRNSAYEVLINKCKEICKEANKTFVCKRIANMRTSFRRELKKIRDSKRAGCSKEDIYIPSLWYFDMLLFLLDGEEIERTETSTALEEFEEGGIAEEEESMVIHNVYFVIKKFSLF